MRSELDREFDEILAAITGPGGRLVLGSDEQDRPIVTNFPATLPEFFRTFCALNAEAEAVVAGDERLTFADLDRISERMAHGLVASGVEKGDRVAIAMRNCPSWIVSYMAILKAGAIAVTERGEQLAPQRRLDADMPLARGARGGDLPADQVAAVMPPHCRLDRVALIQIARPAGGRQFVEQAALPPGRP